MAPGPPPPGDRLLCIWGLDLISRDQDDFRKNPGKLMPLLKCGGHLVHTVMVSVVKLGYQFYGSCNSRHIGGNSRLEIITVIIIDNCLYFIEVPCDVTCYTIIHLHHPSLHGPDCAVFSSCRKLNRDLPFTDLPFTDWSLIAGSSSFWAIRDYWAKHKTGLLIGFLQFNHFVCVKAQTDHCAAAPW